MSQTLDDLRAHARDNPDDRVEFTALADDLERKELAEAATRPPDVVPPPPVPRSQHDIDLEKLIEILAFSQTRLAEVRL